MGLRVLYADFEKSLRGQRNYVKNIGVDIDDKKKFIHIEPSCYEDGAKAVLTAMLVFKPGLIVIDSLATAIPRAFLKGNLDEAAQVGLHAKLTTTFIGNLNAHLKDANSAIIVINQFRSNIKKDQYEEGPKEITTGGLASKYAYMWRCELKPTSDKEEVTGISDTTGIKEAKLTNQKVKLIMVKNKIDKPFRSSFVYITFGVGIDGIRSVQALAENKGLIKAKGAWYGYTSKNDPTLSFNLAGRPAVTNYLKAHPEIVNDMKPQLFPQIDSEEYMAAKESGSLAENGDSDSDEEELTPEQMAAIANMENSMDAASSSMKLPNED
jgi:RecA/RadA recombinase